MFSKINISRIVVDHIKTLQNYGNNKISIIDLFIFFGVPILIAVVLLYENIFIDDSTRNILITSLSIFTGLLFNLLLLVYDIIQKKSGTTDTDPVKKQLLNEIFSNISFCILISILNIITLCLSLIGCNFTMLFTMNFLNYFLISTFILALLMILKRVHLLLTKEF